MSVKGAASMTMPQNDSIPHEKIAMRAYEKWCKRGRPHGSEKQDWAEAEAELRAESKKAPAAPAMAQRR
jgi:hypothetical protein